VAPGDGVDPFEELSRVRGAAPIEDAYLFGRRLRVVARPGAEREARRLVEPFGLPAPAEPSLEDVFVSLTRQQPAVTETVAV
jgi:hypothetical protein